MKKKGHTTPLRKQTLYSQQESFLIFIGAICFLGWRRELILPQFTLKLTHTKLHPHPTQTLTFSQNSPS